MTSRPLLLRANAWLFFGLFTVSHAANLTLRQDSATHTLSVYRDNVPQPILTQNARPDFRLNHLPIPGSKSV